MDFTITKNTGYGLSYWLEFLKHWREACFFIEGWGYSVACRTAKRFEGTNCYYVICGFSCETIFVFIEAEQDTG
ncbi:Uncharacterized protein TCM_010887 [Theobroma cacao]|uniref:Uncharacterized protein n=1 Tax=Theobroma cacao TaxID=3641 RepID=A0A061E9D3_THECC|nr:Uncharacterized protein TCM_010887 [Theobroma cacao]